MAKKRGPGYRRVLLTSDWHCGHQVGLSPPRLHAPIIPGYRNEKYAHVRKEVWTYFDGIMELIRPIDIMIVVGDALEGKGERSGGTELVTADRKIQCQIAVEVVQFINADKVRFVYGTPGHTGTEEDWEDIIAEAVGAPIGSHEWYNINGKVLDCKHKISSSQIPYGNLTPLAREIAWNRVWAARGGQRLADVLVRGHAHRYAQIDHDNCLGFVLPALQGFGSKYGSRQCSGTVDIGVVVLDIYDDGEIKWKTHKITGETQTAGAEIL